MNSLKLSVTHRGRLKKKYGAAGLATIDQAVSGWIVADAGRGFTTLHLALDDQPALAPYGVPALAGAVTAQKVKKTVDALVAKLSPDYLILFGSGEILPHFTVPNPTLQATGDPDPDVPTDNPYACSRLFDRKKRATYLIPDRVVGRIPDLPGSNDPAWLLGYLEAATQWQPAVADEFADDLLVCCDTWKQAGEECVSLISRKKTRLLLSPPSGDADNKLRGRHAARLQMIKCHGAERSAAFYGQKGNHFPEVLVSTSLEKRVTRGTVVGAMCCFGAALFDPDEAGAVLPGKPPVASVYLRQGAYGFAGSTTTAWVGVGTMLCADWVIGAFLRHTLRGASLGRAFLDAKQELVRWIEQQGRTPDLPEEKTLLQFYLLGDPSIHPLIAAPAVAAGAPGLALTGAAFATAVNVAAAGTAEARKARRAFRFALGDQLRSTLPTRMEAAGTTAARQDLAPLVEQLAGQVGDLAGFDFHFERPVVHEVKRPIPRPEIADQPLSGLTAALPAAAAGPVVQQESLEYYWAARKDSGPVREIRLVKVATDRQGNILSTLVLASS